MKLSGTIRVVRVFAFLAIAALAPIASVAHAQMVPFGKNKIQYRGFDWRILPGPHIDVYYYPEEEEVAKLALAYGEESYAYLERKFQHHPFRRIPLIVYSSDQHFEQTNVFPGFIPEGVLGFTEYLKRRVALPFRGDYNQFRNTLRHELVHAFQLSKITETMAQHPRQRRPSPQGIHWFTEGLAEYWSSEQTAEDEMFVRDLVVRGRLPSIKQFNYIYSFMSYPVGAELHKYLSGRFGEEYIARIYEEYWKYDTFEQTLEAVFNEDLEQLSREWRYALEQRFFPGYANRPPFDIVARPIATKGGANFKPVLYTKPGETQPDLYFMSPRTGYTNIYRTNLERGEKGVETVVHGERSAEFESFHAYESRFDINAKGIIVFVSKYQEHDALLLWDIAKKDVVGRYQWPDLVGMKSPAWDPTGNKVVFEGLSNVGYSDLYTIDFNTQQRTAVTHDVYREEDPDWSPDGRAIVFASDRNQYGRDGFTNLYLVDVASQSLQQITDGRWNDQDPRWSPDGARILFSSDRAGSFDLYAVDRTGAGRRITSMTGGAFDPEWLPDGKGAVFTGFEEGGFRIFRYVFDTDTTKAPQIDTPLDRPIAQSPTWDWGELKAPVIAATETQEYKTLDKVSVDFAGGDAIVAPGVGTAQGAQFLLSDMLGNHMLFTQITAVQASGLADFVNNFSGNLFYLNLSHRLNYGGGLFRFKGRFRDVTYDIYDENTWGGFFIASYPISKFRRLQFEISAEHSNRVDTEDPFEFGDFGVDTRAQNRNLTRDGILTSNYVSYVKDNTLWLPTGPIDGERYNITAGTVTCFSCDVPSAVTGQSIRHGAMAENYVVFGDYRRYIRTSLFSAYAIRAYGFFSDGAIPARAVLGGPAHLRGYPRFSLTGSRLWLVNQEWRFPLLHALSFAFPFGNVTLPGIQGAVFADIGSSWLESMKKPEGT
ncbi:MAG TPA: DPP IV N-terminal domain-containing protein, partial [Longimicrobiales bacterium]|nr:DPP IV N-terminal domain-containing protein [Longimicrobiales bacterium]